MKRNITIISILFLFAAGLAMTLLRPVDKPSTPLSGGATTVFTTSRDAFAKPAANLPTEKLREFTFGNKMFNTHWVTAPASVTTLDGLGPTFNRVSCSGCHFKDGRGRPPYSADEPMNSMLLRLSVAGAAQDGGPNPHPAYGGQLNDKAIHGVPAEGRATITYTEIPGHYADGEAYALQKPQYHFESMHFGELGQETMFSPRVAPVMIGLGLLEAIPDQAIQAVADPDDANRDGISGRINHVWDSIHSKQAIGRFGWKANQPSLQQQVAGAALGDMGITTTANPQENCPDVQTACKNAINGGTPEMSDEQLRKMVFYSQTLAVPARRHMDDKVVQRGETLFRKAQCSACHTESITTGEHPIAALSHQEIHPYTDLLLHDMGTDLADNRPDYEANGNEWRTPPLWGIGLVKTVNKHTRFLHDGRARDLTEAILWHGGEGERAREAFKAMPKEDRDALVKFLESL